MKKSLLFLLVGSMIFAAACSDKAEETTAATTAAVEETTTTAAETAAEETAAETAAEETVAEETTTVEETTVAEETTAAEETVAADQGLRSAAEGYVGKSCTELVAAIGEASSLHPGGTNDESGMYLGYLHYEGFEVEFESSTETYIENGDLSDCTVIAIVDSIFDN